MTTVRLSRDLAEQGYTYAEMTRMVRDAELVRVRRGAYADREPPLDPRLAHLQLLEATVAQSAKESVVSHASAALVHDVPIGPEQLDRVHLTRDREGQGKIRRYVQVHGLALDEGDVVAVNGFRVTSLARTVLDLGCALPPLLAVPIGDAALRAGMSAVDLAAQLDRSTRRHGIARARRTAALLDERSESAARAVSRYPRASVRSRAGPSGRPKRRTTLHRSTPREEDGRWSARPGASGGADGRSVARTCCGISDGRSSAGSGPSSSHRWPCLTGCTEHSLAANDRHKHVCGSSFSLRWHVLPQREGKAANRVRRVIGSRLVPSRQADMGGCSPWTRASLAGT